MIKLEGKARNSAFTYTREIDTIIYSTISNRGDNTVNAAAGKARKKVFALANKKLTLPMIKNRYYKIRNDKDYEFREITRNPNIETTNNIDARKFLVDMLMSKENVTLEIQGKQITAVFK